MPTSLVRYTSPADTIHKPVEESAEEIADTDASAVTLQQTEKEAIRRALEINDGRRKDTARYLNISERTLYRKIKDFGLE